MDCKVAAMRVIRSLSLVCCLILLVGFSAHAGLSQQPDPDLPDRPAPGLPNRPHSRKEPEVDDALSELRSGGHIELVVEPRNQVYWTVVEWQGSNETWHQVDRWRGYTLNGRVRWFVRPADLGKGPFRWVVYEYDGGPLLVSSEQFHLPAVQAATARRQVSLALKPR